jgi:HK97 family phage major capsid protein
MTTPATRSITTGSFSGVLTPAQVAALLNELIEGAPFSGSLTRAPTATGKMAFPTAAPSGFSWLEELAEVPDLLLGDKAMIVSVAKIAGTLPISAEMISDASVNITGWVGSALTDSLSRDLDVGVLRGTGAPQPTGIIAQADAVTGPTLLAAAGAAIAAIGEAGGQANTIAMSPTAYAAELTATDTTGRPIHPDGLGEVAGLAIVQVPGLADGETLVYDAQRIYLVLGQDSAITVHDDYRHDSQVLLVKARCNVGAPVKAKSLRKLSVTPASATAGRKGS